MTSDDRKWLNGTTINDPVNGGRIWKVTGFSFTAVNVAINNVAGVNPVPVVLPDGVNTYSSVAAVAGGTVAVGARKVVATFSNDFNGTFNGAARPVSSQVTIEAEEGKSLPAIPYTIAAGTIYIDRVGV